MKQILLKTVMLMFALMCSVGMWAEEPVYTLSFTKLTTGTNYNSYTGAHTITCSDKEWSVFGNQSLGDYIRVGGKTTTATDRTLTSTAALVNKKIGKVTINHSGTGNGSNSSITVNSITVTGSTGSGFLNPKTKKISSPSVSSAGSIDFVLNNDEWDANSFFKIIVNYQITGSNNCYLTINSIDFYEVTTPAKTLQSIAITGTPTKTSYFDGDALDPAGLVVTGTYDVGDPEVITEGIEWTLDPKTLSTGNTSCDVMASVGSVISDVYSVTGLTVVAIPTYTAHFSVNGVEDHSADFVGVEGAAITFPSDPADINGKEFQGWTKTADYSNSTTAPSDLCKAANMGNGDVTYYAVFASIDEDIKTVETVGFESAQGYTATTTYNSSSYTTGSTGSKWTINYGAFATSGAISDSQSAQFRIYASGGGFGQLRNTVAYENDITMISFKAKAANANGKVKVSYSTDGKNWTDIETISLTTTTTTYEEEIPVTGVRYIKFTAAGTKPSSSNYSIYVDDIAVSALGKVNTNYCTTVAAIPATVDVTIGSTGYATFYAPYNMNFEGTSVTAFLVEPDVENNVVHMTSVDKVPAGTALVVKGASASVPTTESADPVTTALEVSASATAYDNVNTYYYLGVDNGTVGFRPLAEGGSIAAGKCFFKVSVTPGASPRWFAIADGEETAIKSISTLENGATFNLAGQRVGNDYKGIVIKNGKKVLVK